MDPLSIFYDIHELIIQHFEYKDIFKYYKVSKSWNELVLQHSKFAMNKIRLNVKESNHDEVLNVLEQKTSEINDDLLNLLNSTRKYQNIKIYVDHGWDFIDQLVRNLSSSLVDVEVSSDIFAENLDIPNLKCLKIDNPLIEGLTTCSKSLKKLTAHLSGKEYWLKKESPIAIKSALKKNNFLDAIELDDSLTSLIFEHDISQEVNFKLNSLSVEFSKAAADDEIFLNFRNFLENQKQLRNIKIQYSDIYTIQWIFENALKLESLQTNIHFENSPRAFHLSINGTLKNLDLNISSNWQYTMSIKYALRTFITSSPNLEVLKIRMTSPLDMDDFRFLLFNAPKLKQLTQNAYDCFYTYQEVYEQLKQDHDNISPHVEFLNIFC